MKTKGLRLALALTVAALFVVGCEPETVMPAGAAGAANRSAEVSGGSLVGTLWKNTLYDDGALASQYGYDMKMVSTNYYYFVNDSIISRTLRFEVWCGEDYRDSISRDFEEWKYSFNGEDTGYFYPVERAWQIQQFVRVTPDRIELVDLSNEYNLERVDGYDF